LADDVDNAAALVLVPLMHIKCNFLRGHSMELFGSLPLMANINMESSPKTHATGILNH